MSERRLDLSTNQARTDASKALPALMWASALGNAEASAMAGQIIGQSITDALAPSFAALARLRAAEVRSTDTTAHDLDRMGICRRCGQGITAKELLDGEERCDTTNREIRRQP